MPMISFTEDDLLFASGRWLPDVIANESGDDCDGECCGLCPELMLPAEAYLRIHQAEWRTQTSGSFPSRSI